jgi:hypothetical protein
MIMQRVTKSTSHWLSVSEMFVAKTILCWILETVFDQRTVRRNPYPALGPAEGIQNLHVCVRVDQACQHVSNVNALQWTSGASAVSISGEVHQSISLWRYALLLLGLGTAIGTCTIWSLIKKIFGTQAKTATLAKHSSIQDALVITKGHHAPSKASFEFDYQMTPHKPGTLTVSPIREVVPLVSEEPRDVPSTFTSPKTISVVGLLPMEERVVNKSMLALSGVSTTIDIPPLSPQNFDEDAILHLSDLLEKW